MTLSLYLHIPFCVRKCPYCDFVSIPAEGETIDRYLSVLCREIGEGARLAGGECEVETIHVGGGTPSLLTPRQVGRLLHEVDRFFTIIPGAEVTMEVNPATVKPESLAGYRSAGVNRLSIGIQSLDDGILSVLGRVHTSREGVEAFHAARRAGFDSVGIDLIHSVPGMELRRWGTILEDALSLSPDHLSAYALTPERGTPLGDDVEAGVIGMPDDDLSAAMYQLTDDLCSRRGLFRYEISNHARPGYESRHNSRYWLRGFCLGCGVAAHSFLPLSPWGSRFRRTDDLHSYLVAGEGGEFPLLDRIDLTRTEAAEETLFLGLRMTDGVDRQRFAACFGEDPAAFFPVIQELEQQGLLRVTPDRIALPPHEMVRSMPILSRFL